MTFRNAQEIFKKFKLELNRDPDVKGELQDIIKDVVESYNTTIYENRFVVGGIIEHIIAATFNAFPCFKATHIGKSSQRKDIEVTYKKGSKKISAEFSIKSAFTKTISGIILINFQGSGASVVWDEPTILVLARNGMIYVDRDLLPSATINRGDSLVLKYTDIKKHKNTATEYHIDVNIPVKPETKKSDTSKVASEDLAKFLLQNYKRLKI